MPAEDRSRLISLAQFDENIDDWILKKESNNILRRDREIAHIYRRPVSEHCIGQDGVRYRVSEIL